MKAHFLIHVPYEDPGAIVNWCENNGYDKTFTRFYEKVWYPQTGDFDLLIIMGGPMSVNDENEIKWLAGEKKFIRNAINENKKVTGICLGAQLIASALGAKVKKNRYKEIGWHTVTFHNEAREKFPFLPSGLTTFHWHGDTFDLPEEALPLGYSQACDNQGFVYGENVVALQFHPEMTESVINTLVDECANELEEDSPFIMSREEIFANNNIKENNKLLFDILHNLTAGR